MAKGGRYLAKNKNMAPGGKKKGRGWKILLIALAVLLILFAVLYFMASSYLTSMLNKINRAEVEDRGASVEDVLDWATYNPDAATYNPEDAVQIPSDIPTGPVSQQTTGESIGE